MKDRWSQLSMSEKSDLMSLYIRNGISSLEEIKKHYNSFQTGGRLTFNEWKSQMQSKYPDIEMDNTKAGYDYIRYFNDNYEDAIKQLSELKHFPDTYKLPNHKTFSNESIYSRGPMMGGNWINDSTFSPSIINRQQYPNIYKENRPYTEREIYNSFATGGQMNTDGPKEDKNNKGHVTFGTYDEYGNIIPMYHLNQVNVGATQPYRTPEQEAQVTRERNMYFDAMRHFNYGNQDAEGLKETYAKYPELRSYLKRIGMSENDFMSAATGRDYETNSYERERTRQFNKDIQKAEIDRANTFMQAVQHQNPNDQKLAAIMTGILGGVTGTGILGGLTQVGSVGTAIANEARYALPVIKGLTQKAAPTLFDLGLGVLGYEGFNEASRRLTGNSLDYNIASQIVGGEPTQNEVMVASFMNPGGWFGGTFGSRLVNSTANAIDRGAANLMDRYTFVNHPNSFTRGIGNEVGLRDLVESGLVRGNPVGTEVSAKDFGKLFGKNRNNFRDIMQDTGLKDIEHRFYNRTLTEQDFNAIKEAAKKYQTSEVSSETTRGIKLKRADSDPLYNYANYEDYQAALASDRQTLTNATSLDESGQPLAYFYDDGRNPLTQGHTYAASKYGVRINNADTYNPRIFEGHLHYSMPEAVSLADPNVEVFRKGPFGLTLKMNKGKLLSSQNPVNLGSYNPKTSTVNNSMFSNPLGEGSEHTVFSNGDRVLKVHFDGNNSSLEELLENAGSLARNRNLVSEQIPISLEGYVTNNVGKQPVYHAVFSQEKLTPLTESLDPVLMEDLNNRLRLNGWELDKYQGSYINKTLGKKLIDVSPQNIGIKDGKYYIIDGEVFKKGGKLKQ